MSTWTRSAISGMDHPILQLSTTVLKAFDFAMPSFRVLAHAVAIPQDRTLLFELVVIGVQKDLDDTSANFWLHSILVLYTEHASTYACTSLKCTFRIQRSEDVWKFTAAST